jgi:Lrp/AsnC family transcriptional regulator
MDAIDKQILEIIQRNAETPLAEISAAVNLSTTPCLMESGVVRKRVALLDAAKLNVGVTVFVSIRTNQHSPAWFRKFHATVVTIPEVMEFYRMSGDVDYLLRVVVPDIAAYDRVYKKLIASADLFDVSSSFAMEELKNSTELPLQYAH